MLHNDTKVKLNTVSKTRKTDLLIKTKLEKQDIHISCSRHRKTKFTNSESPIFFVV